MHSHAFRKGSQVRVNTWRDGVYNENVGRWVGGWVGQ
jgi:hypothetical protein